MDFNFHFIHRVRSQAKTLVNRTALRYFKDNNWLDISWAELQQQIDQISLALLANHIDIQDKIGIFYQKQQQLQTSCHQIIQQYLV